MMMKILLWLKLHRIALIVAATVVAVLGLAVGLSLGLTLPIEKVELTGEVSMLTGESYEGGLTLVVTYRSGRVTETPVTADMLEGFDPALRGRQEVSVSYKKHKATTEILVIGNEDLTLCVREGTLKTEFEPNEAFPTSGIFDLYYNGSIYRSSPITLQNAPNFTTRRSRDYDITLYYREGLGVSYHYTVLEIIATITPSGQIYMEQGVELVGQPLRGTLILKVLYKDGAEETIPIYHPDIMLDAEESLILEDRDEDYEDATVLLVYKGNKVECPVYAFVKGSLLDAEEIHAITTKRVYIVGESFDFAGSYLRVKYKRFEGVLDMPITADMLDRSPIFEEANESLDILVSYGRQQDIINGIRVITEEESLQITSLSTGFRSVLMGEIFDLTDATFSVVYGYGYTVSEEMPLTEDMLSIYDGENEEWVPVTAIEEAGPHALRLTYSYLEAEPESSEGEAEETGESAPPSLAEKRFEQEITVLVMDPNSDEITQVFAVERWSTTPTTELVVPEDAYLDCEKGWGYRRERIYLATDEDVEIKGFVPGETMQALKVYYKGAEVYSFEIEAYETPKVVSIRIPTYEDPNAESVVVYVGENAEDDFRATPGAFIYNTDERKPITLGYILDLPETSEDPEVLSFGKVVGDYDLTSAGSYYLLYVYYKGPESENEWVYGIVGLYVESSEDETEDPQPKRLELERGTGAVAEYERRDLENGETSLDYLDLTDLKLYLVYSDESREEVGLNKNMFVGFDVTVVGEGFAATVQYYYNGADGVKIFPAQYIYSVKETIDQGEEA